MDDDFDAGAARPTDDRPRGVSKAKLADVDLQPKMSIFYRPHRNTAMVPLETSFSKEAAMIFCDRVRSEVEDAKSRSFVVTGGDQSAYKMIFTWINDCIQSQSIEKFPDVPEPEDDPFAPTINIIIAGEKLGVPAGSLSFHLKKRLNGCARKNLMPFSQVREFYDMHSEVYNLGLKDIACASVFNAWWDARLDESVSPELMEELSDMRDHCMELDNDLHEACKNREEEVRKKWADKKAKKAAEEAGGDEWDNTGANNDNPVNDGGWGNTGTAGVSGDWDTAPVTTDDWNTPNDGLTQATSPASGDWENQNVNTHDVLVDWSKPQKPANDDWAKADSDPPVSKDWADEMNDPILEPPQTVPKIRW